MGGSGGGEQGVILSTGVRLSSFGWHSRAWFVTCAVVQFIVVTDGVNVGSRSRAVLAM